MTSHSLRRYTVVFTAGVSVLLLPQLTRADVTLAEAVDFPGFAPPELWGYLPWHGTAGVGHDGIDAATSPALQGDGFFQSARMVFPNPLVDSAVDGRFWWSTRDTEGSLVFATVVPSTAYAFGVYAGPILTPAGHGWESVRFHYDQGPLNVFWSLSSYIGGHAGPPIPEGDSAVDQFTWNGTPLHVFHHALDTDEPGAGQIGVGGWSSIGAAMVAVKSAPGFHGGDALEIVPDPEAGAGSQSTTLTTMIGAGSELVFRTKRGPNPGATMSVTLGPVTLPAVTPTTNWAEIHLPLPVAAAPGNREVQINVSVPGDDPAAFILFDAVSLVSHVDVNAALETKDVAWTVGGTGALANVTADGLWASLLKEGDSIWLESTFTGPGTVVFAASAGYYRGASTTLLVDGEVRDLNTGQPSPFWLQARVEGGAHVVRWQHTVTRPAGTDARMQLNSCAFIPDLPANQPAAVLGAAYHGQVWQLGVNPSPSTLFSLHEGETSIRGIRLVPASPGSTPCFLETTVTGPADVDFHWSSIATAFCKVNGHKAASSFAPPVPPAPFYGYPIPPTTLHLPAGSHTLRWEAGTAPADWKNFSVRTGSPIGEYFTSATSPSQPPMIWVTQTMGRGWVLTNDTGVGSDDPDIGDPGTYYSTSVSIPPVPVIESKVLTGGDNTYGKFWATGPAVLFLEMRQRYIEDVFVQVGEVRHYLTPYGDYLWHPQAVSIPEGEHELLIAADYDDLGSSEYVWLRHFHLVPAGTYTAWAAARGLPLIHSSPSGDTDADGMNQLLEFAFATDPSSANGFPMPAITTGAGRQLHLPALPYDATGLRYEVQITADLQTWTTVATVNPNAGHQPGPIVPLPPASAAKEFVRVVVHL